MMRPPERSRVWKCRRIAKAAFLTKVLERLDNDVVPYIKLIRDTRQRTGHGIGFWALARMVFPVIESVGTVLFHWGRGDSPPVRLLRSLEVSYPNLVWQMYRHTLMHNDEMATASYRGRKVGWLVGVDSGHFARRGLVGVDLTKLVEDLVTFLKKEIARPGSSQTSLWMRTSFRFTSRTNRGLKAELKEVGAR